MYPGFFNMGPIILLPFRRKACWGFLSPFKNPTASARFEPANLGIRGHHTTSAPPKPLSLSYSGYCVRHYPVAEQYGIATTFREWISSHLQVKIVTILIHLFIGCFFSNSGDDWRRTLVILNNRHVDLVSFIWPPRNALHDNPNLCFTTDNSFCLTTLLKCVHYTPRRWPP
jgi:hypothetical protein